MSAAPVPGELDVQRFWHDGYIVMRGLVDRKSCEQQVAIARQHLGLGLSPVEFEAEVGYPGSPASLQSEGGATVRRLLSAITRDASFRDYATGSSLRDLLARLWQHDGIMLCQSHHNCIMTKQPGFSSATLWHQDNRYWSFDEENLISVWLALGDETQRNGCLRVIPGSHKLDLERGRLDASLFLRPDLEENKDLLSRSVPVELHSGDVLFFHSRLFHAAGRNLSDEVKLSAVFTYHQADNKPISGTRSARYPSIRLSNTIA